jgi:ssDNA-binding Zn-finger/Zn-ribbon topoisomerase 1
VLVILAFALALFLVYTRIIRQPPRQVSEVVVCAECHHVFEVRVAAGKGGAPYECTNPACRKKSAYLAFQCENPECRAIFPVTPGQMRNGEEIVCPVCGGRAVLLMSVPDNADALAGKAAK